MIVSYKYQPKIKDAKKKLETIEGKVNEQRQKMTTQQELKQINIDIEKLTDTASAMRRKLDMVEREYAMQKNLVAEK